MNKILVMLMVLTFNNTGVFAGNICEAEFLGLHNIATKSEMKRIKRIEKMETIRNKIRKLKEEPGAIAVDNHHFELFQSVNQQLFEGRISLARDKWKGLFRRVERHYYFVKKKQVLVRDVLLLRQQNPSSILQELTDRYSKDPFMLDILKYMSRKDFKSGDHIIATLESGIKKSAKYLGWKESNFEFIHKELELLLKNKKCKKLCKSQIRLLKRELGVGAKDEQQAFPMFKGLTSVNVKDLKSLVNTVPVAKEAKLYKSIFYELSKYLQEKLVQPKWRGVIADILYTLTGNWGWSAKHIDSIFTEAINVSNHYFPINKVILRAKNLANQIEKLKNQNAAFLGDTLLLTFARRTDDAARSTWLEILAEVQKSDTAFHKRMVAAQKKALKRKPLAADYEKSPHRLTAYLIAGGAGFAYLYLNYNVSDAQGDELIGGTDISADGTLVDLGDVDLNEGDQVIEVNSAEELDQTLEVVEAIQNRIVEVENE